MKNIFLITLLVFGLLNFGLSQETSPINIEASYVGDGFSNFEGGMKTGQTYLGKLNFGLGFNTNDFGLWNGGEFFIQIENTHGGNPSGDYIGDLQVASNIDNGDYTYLYEMWYKQQVGKFSAQMGVIDLNADYFVAEPGGLFLNSSFGIQPSASMNMPVPIFPMNALGVNLQFQFTDAISLQTALWDGDPSDLDRDPYNVQWKLSKEEGFLSATELHFKHNLLGENNAGIIKLGLLYHSAEFETIADSTITEKGNLQFHLVAEQTLINKEEGEKGKLDAFMQIGYLPNNTINVIPFYLGAGINYTGLLFNDASDVLGLAVAYSGISKEAVDNIPDTQNFETAIELSYAMQFFNQITIQPDLQYIINTGANSDIDNAFVGFLRVIIEH